MSELSYLEKLLSGAEVEWLALGDLTKYEQPTKYLVKAKNYNDEFITPVLTAGKTFILGYTDETHGIYRASKSPVIIFDDFTTANKWVDFDFKAKSSAMKMITSSDDVKFSLKYIYYWLNTLPSELVEGDHKRQWISGYTSKRVPIPCPGNPKKSLAIQAEIVRILDKFTAHTTELSAELTARKKQYNYYCEQLLSFDENIPFVQLSDCCVTISDGDHQAPPKTDSGVPFITISNITRLNTIDFENTYYVSDDYYQRIHDKRKARKKDILYTVVGSIGIPVFIDFDMKFAFQRHMAILRPDEKKIISKYLYHVMRSSTFFKKAHSVAVGAAQKTITLSALNKMNVPIPPIGEQERIVNILDKFDTLANSNTEGLPREIELRQKQYEYYRDMLFSFPRPEVAEA
ncbi:TPA: restriction endonuclease subunit S [Raoultella ornithinolytica]|uniref:restriction endonuclease subunit S n=1 Tax=Raoultella ornithinolytica TaxID=54291 RepID=UPI002DB9AC39|nr:restriction endonuclease subunit S [Raoultella ornithinolytica]MEB7961153.1 restriction endonuclease subunit S [Raoultella ornithinolytica]